MAKSSTYLLRLDPQKKALWERVAKDSGEKSLASWIEAACECYIESCKIARQLERVEPGIWGAEKPALITRIAVPESNLPPEPFAGQPYDEQPTSISPQTDTNPVAHRQVFERKPVGKIAKMLKEKG